MANQNVQFFFTSDIKKYQNLAIKEPFALYFVEDSESGFCGLYKGENLIATGSEVNEKVAGLLSPEDYAQLRKLIDAGPALTITPADDTISIVDGKIGVQVSKTEGNLVSVNEDGLFVVVESLPLEKVIGLSERLNNIERSIQGKYIISNTPEGTLVNYKENEIRVMCPADAKFVKQQVGEGGNPNMYYMTFTAYAPDAAVTFKEGDRGVIIDEVLNFETTAGAGVDKYGRKFKHHWLAIASYDETSDTWVYFGKNSSVDKYIGWDYIVEWFDENGVMIEIDQIRINLSNEDCHNNLKPYYMKDYATVKQVEEIVEESLVWNEIVEF